MCLCSSADDDKHVLESLSREKLTLGLEGEDSHVWTSTLVLRLLKHEDSGHPAAAAPERHATQYVSYWSSLSIWFCCYSLIKVLSSVTEQ